jgi:predicted nucleic acid-binding protein
VAEEGSRSSLPRVIFDTDVLVWYFRGSARARRFLLRVAHPARAVSALTVMELLQGCRGAAEIRDVKAFVSDNMGLLVHPNEAICHRAMQLIEAHAARDGLRVIDALIAATALQFGSVLATANVKHYRAIPRLGLSPFKP